MKLFVTNCYILRLQLKELCKNICLYTIYNCPNYLHYISAIKTKMLKMINDRISEGKYVHTEDTIIKDLSSFQSFLPHHFKDHSQYKDMCPANNQPARLFATAKTYKFHNI